MKTLIIIVIFFLTGAFFIISNNNLQMNSSQNIDKFVNLYFQWIDKIIINAQGVSGYVVKMGWLPGEGK